MEFNPESQTEELHTPAAPEQPPPSGFPAENPTWHGWDVFRLALIQFVIPFLVIIPVAVLLAQKTIYRGLSFGQVGQKLWIALCTQFVWYLIVAVYMVMFVEGTYRQRFWDAIRWNWPRRT